MIYYLYDRGGDMQRNVLQNQHIQKNISNTNCIKKIFNNDMKFCEINVIKNGLHMLKAPENKEK